jgi:hypothetical protein
VQASAKTNRSLRRIHGNVAHRSVLVIVRGNDDVDVLDDALKGGIINKNLSI